MTNSRESFFHLSSISLHPSNAWTPAVVVHGGDCANWTFVATIRAEPRAYKTVLFFPHPVLFILTTHLTNKHHNSFLVDIAIANHPTT